FGLFVGAGRVGALDHGVDEVDGDHLAAFQIGQLDLAGLHRAAGDEDGGDIQAHGGEQHARGDLVAVGNAHHGVGAMRIDHVFHAVGDQFARGQRVEHAAVTHGDTVVYGDGVELFGHTAGRFDFARDHLAQILEVHMARHELGEGVDHGDDGLAEV